MQGEAAADVQVLPPQPKQIPLLIQLCRQRYRNFTDKNIDRISTYKNKRCILGVFHPFCNAFLIIFIALPRDLVGRGLAPAAKITMKFKGAPSRRTLQNDSHFHTNYWADVGSEAAAR